MSHQHLFSSVSYPVFAYLMACLGSALGLACARRFRARGLRAGWNWLVAGALTLGSGIWGMHFIAMLGYSVDGVELRYDVRTTVLSLVIAVGIVGAGMLVAGLWQNWITLLSSGFIAGLGVAAMHYIGMSALRFPGTTTYSTSTVLLSVGIAVVAATAALWATLRVNNRLTIAIAAVVMGLAISGMHYTGMVAAKVTVGGALPDSGSVTGIDLVAPLIIGLVLEVLLVWFAVLTTSVEERRDISLREYDDSPSPVGPRNSSGSYEQGAPNLFQAGDRPTYRQTHGRRAR